MSVYLYEGLPGSGKSYHVLKDTIIGALKEGRRVFHNLPIENDTLEASEFHIGFLRRKLIKVNQEFLLNLPKYKPVLQNCLLVIDEAHETFFSGDKITDVHLRNFWTWHRHLNMDIAVITQVKSNLNKIIQSVIAARFEFRNLSFLGLKGAYEVKQYEGYDGKTVLGKKRGRFLKKYFEYYHSIDFGSTGLFKISTPTNFSVYKVAGGLVVLLIVGIWAFSSMSYFEKSSVAQSKAVNAEKEARNLKTIANISRDSSSLNRFNSKPAEKIPEDEKPSLLPKMALGNVPDRLAKNETPDKEAVGPEHKVRGGAGSRRGLTVPVKAETFNHVLEKGRYTVSGFIGVGPKKMHIVSHSSGRARYLESSEILEVGREIRIY
jgi:zona occludens toxin